MRVVQPVDTSPNTTNEETSEEVPIQMTDAGVQVSDESKSVIAELSKKYRVWKSNFVRQNFDLKTSVKIITTFCFTLVFPTTPL